MQVILKAEMTLEEAAVICKMIGPTSIHSRKTDFNLTEKETYIAKDIYDVLSKNVGGHNE